MDYEDLELSNWTALIGLIVVFTAGLFLKATIFLRHERAGIGPLYPDSWNAKQRQILERFRLLIGLALIPLWAAYLLIRPSMLTSESSGYLGATSLISMLLVSYAWTLLLATQNWKRLDVVPRSFLLLIALLVFWWGTAFSAIGWMLAAASAPPPFRVVPLGVYAARPLSQMVLAEYHCVEDQPQKYEAAGRHIT